MPDAGGLVYNLVHIALQMIIIQLPLSVFSILLSQDLHLPHLRITNLINSFKMKWLLALAPLAAAFPALPTQELADAPPAGSVRSYLSIVC